MMMIEGSFIGGDGKNYAGGFKDFEAFNKAMLVKQGWRILHYPNALVNRIFKQKYFSNDAFMQAKVGNVASFWRSII